MNIDIKMSSTIVRSISCVDNAVVMIVSDEVEMVMRSKIRQVLEFFYVELCRREMMKQLTKECEGCKKDWPSQWDHACCITRDEDLWTFYFDDVKHSIDLSLLQDSCIQFVKLMDVPMTDEWNSFILNLPSMNSSVAMMIASDMSFPNGHERSIVNFVNEMCDVKEDNSELSSEIFSEFVTAMKN